MWQLSLVHLVTKSVKYLVFHIFFCNKLVSMVTVDIIIQSEPKKNKTKIRLRRQIFTTCQFRIETFTTRQILNQDFFNA